MGKKKLDAKCTDMARKIWRTVGYCEAKEQCRAKKEKPQLQAIAGFEKYYITECGIVVSTNGKVKVLKPRVKKKGYLHVALYDGNGKPKNKTIHRLVADAFIENLQDKPQVNHLNGDKTDNHISNLEWVTNSENAQHAFNCGLRTSLANDYHGGAKITNSRVKRLREQRSEGRSYASLSRQYNMPESSVHYAIKYGWKGI